MSIRRWRCLTSWPKEGTWVIFVPEFLLVSFSVFLQIGLFGSVCRMLIAEKESSYATGPSAALIKLTGGSGVKWPFEAIPSWLRCLAFVRPHISHWTWLPWVGLQLSQHLKRLLAEGCAQYRLRTSFSACETRCIQKDGPWPVIAAAQLLIHSTQLVILSIYLFYL